MLIKINREPYQIHVIQVKGQDAQVNISNSTFKADLETIKDIVFYKSTITFYIETLTERVVAIFDADHSG